MKERIEIKIPGSYITAICEQYENDNWKMSLKNDSIKKTLLVSRSMNTQTLQATVKMFFEKKMYKDFKQNLLVIKQQILSYKQKNLISNYKI